MSKKIFITGLTVTLVVFFIMLGKVFYLQHGHFKKGEGYSKESNLKLAIREYDLAMHMWTPWSPYIERSAEKLWQIGEMYEEEGKPDWALIAYSSIRSSFYASRSFFTPGKDWIKRCDGKIASLNVRLLLEDGIIKEDDASSEREKFLHVLTTDDAPDVLWSALAEVGFLGWIGSVVFIILKGFESNGSLRRRYAAYGALSFASTFALWVVALLRA